MIKSVWVKAPFREFGKWKTKKVIVGYEEAMVSQGLFHGKKLEKAPVYGEEKYWEHKSFSDTEIDGEKFNRLIEEAVAKLDNEGFKVISVTPVVSGKYNYGAMIEGGYGFGYSYTSGVTILAQKP